MVNSKPTKLLTIRTYLLLHMIRWGVSLFPYLSVMGKLCLPQGLNGPNELSHIRVYFIISYLESSVVASYLWQRLIRKTHLNLLTM